MLNASGELDTVGRDSTTDEPWKGNPLFVSLFHEMPVHDCQGSDHHCRIARELLAVDHQRGGDFGGHAVVAHQMILMLSLPTRGWVPY